MIASLALPSSAGAQLYEGADGIEFSFAVGGDHACAVDATGALFCWGLNDRGQRSVPSGTFNQVIAGDDYTCAVRTDGIITCFGSVTGSWDNWDDLFAVHARPWQVGRDHSCALSSSGRIYCTGRNFYGQATGSSPYYYGSDFRVGRDHNCSINNNGDVSCWGRDTLGQSTVPEGRYREIATGHSHTCAITDTERLRCWGEPDATASNDASSSGSPWSYIWSNSNARFTCAANEDLKLYCWGDNSNGQLNVPAQFSLAGTSPTEEPDPPATESSTESQASSSTDTTTSTSTSSSSATNRTLRGRVIAHVHDRTEAGGEDNYIIEFGFLPNWVLSDQEDWSNQARLAAAVERYEHLLPPKNRWLRKSRIAKLVEDNNQIWLRSDPVTIPFAAVGAGADGLMAGDDTGGVEGRIIARYRPGPGGVLRIEFGFVPEWAFSTVADDVEAQISQHWIRPDPRSLFQRELNRRGIWFRSGEIEISDRPNNGCPVELIGVRPETEVRQNDELDRPIPIGTIRCPFSTELSAISVEGLPTGLRFETRDAGEDQTSILISGTPTAPPRSYSVTITVRGREDDEATARTMITIIPGPTVPRTEWDGYDPNSANVGGSVRLIPPEIIGDGPSVAEWTYRSATPDICAVEPERGSLSLSSEGQCEVVATLVAELPEWAEASETAIVNIGTSSACIAWDGYEPDTMTVGGDSPRLLRPRATDCDTGRSLSLSYTFAPQNPATDICEVSSSGSITARREGTCTIVATSAARDDYGSATSRPSRVTITNKTDPCLDRLSYDRTVQVGASITLRPSSLPSCVGPLTFESSTTSICTVDARNGRLTGEDEGSCSVTVTSAETRTLSEGSRTFRITVDHDPEPPVPCRLSYSGNIEVNDRANADFDCPDGGTPTFRSETPAICSVNRNNGDATGIAEGTCEITANVPETRAYAATTVTAFLRITGLPPMVSISCTPSTANVGDRITCTSRLSGGTPDTYSWSGGDSGDRNGRTYTTIFGTDGSKTISLTVRNSAGRGSDSTRLTITQLSTDYCVDNPRDVNINANAQVDFQPSDYCSHPDGLRLTFRAASSNANLVFAAPRSRSGRWEFDAGSDGGTATIALTATDPNGRSDSTQITVNVLGDVTCSLIPDITTTTGASSQTIDLDDYCRHPAGGRVTYSNADSDNRSAASVSLSGSTLTIRPGSSTGVANISFRAGGSGVSSRTFSNYFEVVVNQADPRGPDDSHMPGGDDDPPDLHSPPPPSGYGLAYCGADTQRLYYFEYTAPSDRQWSKHHLDMPWESASAIWRRHGMTLYNGIRGGVRMIDTLSQSQCDGWTTGSAYTANTQFTPRNPRR